MGMIYNSGDSAHLISALKTNLIVCEQITTQLKSGIKTLLAAVHNKTLIVNV